MGGRRRSVNARQRHARARRPGREQQQERGRGRAMLLAGTAQRRPRDAKDARGGPREQVQAGTRDGGIGPVHSDESEIRMGTLRRAGLVPPRQMALSAGHRQAGQGERPGRAAGAGGGRARVFAGRAGETGRESRGAKVSAGRAGAGATAAEPAADPAAADTTAHRRGRSWEPCLAEPGPGLKQ